MSLIFSQAVLAEISLSEMRNSLEQANEDYFNVLIRINSNETPVFNLDQYDQATAALAQALLVYKNWDEQIRYGIVTISPRRQRDINKLLENLIYYTNSAQLLMVTLSHPALAAVISEVAENTGVVGQNFVRRIIHRTQSSFRTRLDDNNPSSSTGSLFDAVNRAAGWRLQSRPQWLIDYIDRAEVIMEQTRFLSSRRFSGELHQELFYGITSGLLFLTGKISLPKTYFISNEQVADVYYNMEPGDIAVIKHFYKLTNVAFQGDWSHGLIFLDTWERMSAYFNSDRETIRFFTQKCHDEGLDCDSFPSYLQAALPQAVADHREGSRYRGHDVQRVVLEAKGEGVIISNLYAGLKKDQLAVMRPRMSKKAKAIALLRSLEFMRRPYDYGFSLHSRQRLVCTEIIYNAYSPGAGPGVPDFNWDISVVLGEPVNYATDLVKTFAQNYGTRNQKLDLIYFLKANEREGRAYPANVEQFIETAD